MKKINSFMRALISFVCGFFIGSSLYRCFDYHLHPERYAMQSAPWYTGIVVNLILSAVAILIILAVWAILRRYKSKNAD